MLTYSTAPLPTYDISGRDLRIHFGATEVVVGDTPMVQQYEALCDIASDYGTLVTAIIRAKHTLDDEFAIINNGGDQYEAYQAFRAEAKALAQGYIAERGY